MDKINHAFYTLIIHAFYTQLWLSCIDSVTFEGLNRTVGERK